ncbi:PREDICTED: cyclin-dependent kinase inhibitor 3 isoform X2 [Calidris pugnax]|uniref:cyclin-dependent kinase inhibitor 3 isoform X2 n=1 Tax=Calidris pugnax TaxID=198806 RepID=UPI00071E0F65|nr:PREDICTED: cyclin-dependent kinase inhibitor 3 isoform X2 [Calidris pugnax]
MMKPPCAVTAGGFDSSDEEAAEEEDPRPLPISWLPLSPAYSSKFLGLCSLPGCRFKDVRRNLQKDIEELKNYGTQDIFVLCTRGELLKYRVPNLIDTYQQHGICVHHYPIPDGDAPDIAKCYKILEELRSCLESNRKTIVHCYGGLGRSCLAACLLLQLSEALAPQQAIDSLRSLRGSGAIQTIKVTRLQQQYNYLHDFRQNLAAYLATKETLLRSVSR